MRKVSLWVTDHDYAALEALGSAEEVPSVVAERLLRGLLAGVTVDTPPATTTTHIPNSWSPAAPTDSTLRTSRTW
jgi:hypothetical protein